MEIKSLRQNLKNSVATNVNQWASLTKSSSANEPSQWMRYQVPERDALRPCPAVFDTVHKRLVVPAGHAAGVRAALPVSPFELLEADIDVFEQIAAKAQPAFGKHRLDGKRTAINAHRMQQLGYTMVPRERIERALREIPAQYNEPLHKEWCCGPNSAARAAIMLGRNAPNMPQFYKECPTNNILGWRWGPDPKTVSGLLTETMFRVCGTERARRAG